MEDPVKMIDGLRCISTQLIDEGYSEIDNESTMSLDCWQYEFQDQRAFDGDDAYGWSDDEWKGSSLEFGYSPNPISQEEIDRLDMMHFIFAQASDGYLHVAPINCYPQRILDVGCRTGNWSIEMADAYPSAEVIGVDTEPIQPILVPPNLSFEIDGLEDIWNFSGSFDYIHARLLAGRINDWPWLVQQCFEHCNHGGWVEFQEIDPLNSFAELICQPAGNSLEVQSKHLGPILAHWMSEVGFTNIQIIKRSRRDTIRGDLISDEIHTLLNSIDVYIIFGQKP